MKEYPYMTLAQISKYEPEMQALGVSEIARSPRGFLTYYKKIGGNPNNVNEFWRKKRNGFIARFIPMWNKYHTDKIRLALIAWAYLPK